MKKIFLILILMFLFVSVRAEEVDVKLEWIPNVYYNYEKNGLLYWGQLAYIYADGKIAYCMNIEDTISTYKYNASDLEFDNELVTKAGYFGYGYNNEKTMEDYIATQQLIWRYLGWDVYFTTKSGGKGEKISVEDKLLKINDRAGRYSWFPDFEGNFSLEIGEKSYIKDRNNLINNLDIINPSINKIYTDDNSNLIIEAIEVGDNSFTLEKKYPQKYKNVVYEAPNSQKIVVIGEVNKLFNSYYYHVDGGTINIDISKDVIIDSESNENIIELYKDNNLIGTYNVVDNITINNLEFGTYTIKIVNILDGYTYDDEKIEFDLSKDNQVFNKEIELKAKVINLKISKKYGNKKYDLIKSDDNVHYDIYNENGDLLDTIVTDSNGDCTKKLYFGDYIIKQRDVNNVYIYHDDIFIKKNNFIDTEIDIFDELNKVNLRLIGKNNDTFVDYNFIYKNNNYVSKDGIYIFNNLDYGLYDFNNIESFGYISIENINIELNDTIDYYVLDNDLYYDYLINFEKIIIPEIIDTEKENTEIINNDNSTETNDVSNENDTKIIEQEEEKVTNQEENKVIEQEKEKVTEQEENKVIEQEEEKVTEQENNTINNDSKEIKTNKQDKLPYLGVYNVFYKENNINFKSFIFSRMY